VSTELDRKVEALTTSIHALATELREKEVPQDRITSIEAEIEVKSSQIDDLLAEKRNKEVDTKLAELDERLKSFNQAQARTKAAAILAGVSDQTRAAAIKAVGQYTETSFLKALVNRRSGDQDAQEFVKSVLGTSDATGQAVVPNNFVAGLVDQLALNNPYRELFDVVTGVRGAAVDIPYSITGITAALLQGAYGSNKDVRDFSFNQATATLYTIAQIADVGNQLLRQSERRCREVGPQPPGKSIDAQGSAAHHERLGQLRAARLLPGLRSPSVTRPASRRRCRPDPAPRRSPVACRRSRVGASAPRTS
jgi:HK97 family phage major capsid protein